MRHGTGYVMQHLVFSQSGVAASPLTGYSVRETNVDQVNAQLAALGREKIYAFHHEGQRLALHARSLPTLLSLERLAGEPGEVGARWGGAVHQRLRLRL